MLKININKIRIPLALGALGLGGIFLFQYLAFIPEYSSAEEISTDTPVTITPTTPLAKWDDLEYMQQMSPQACAEGNETGKQLVDARDGKSYWVAKLKDDNCWMTQNLDYDDPDGIKITNADGAGGGPNADWENDVSRRQYWDPGYAYYANGITKTALTTSEGEEWSMDTSGKNINTHYLQGNYYSWLSATAEVNSNSTDTTGLCPKGWQMPKSNLNQIDKSFNKLVLNLTEVSLVNNTGPYYFMYGGYVASNSIAFPGHFGSYWSSTSSESGNAYALTFNNTNSGYRVNPSSASSSYCGMPIRCVNSAIVSSTPVDPSESIGSGINDPNVSVSIPNIITLDVSDSVDITIQSNEVSTGTFTAKVESNQNYSISLNAASDSTALINSKDGSKIAEIPTITTTQPTPGTSSWGIRTCSGLDISSCTELYQPLPAKDITNTFLSDTPGSHQHLFQIGIGISPSLPSGTYSTNILVTANQK